MDAQKLDQIQNFYSQLDVEGVPGEEDPAKVLASREATDRKYAIILACEQLRATYAMVGMLAKFLDQQSMLLSSKPKLLS